MSDETIDPGSFKVDRVFIPAILGRISMMLKDFEDNPKFGISDNAFIPYYYSDWLAVVKNQSLEEARQKATVIL